MGEHGNVLSLISPFPLSRGDRGRARYDNRISSRAGSFVAGPYNQNIFMRLRAARPPEPADARARQISAGGGGSMRGRTRGGAKSAPPINHNYRIG